MPKVYKSIRIIENLQKIYVSKIKDMPINKICLREDAEVSSLLMLFQS